MARDDEAFADLRNSARHVRESNSLPLREIAVRWRGFSALVGLGAAGAPDYAAFDSEAMTMLPWQELALKIAATALLLAVVLPLAGFAFTRNGSGTLRALRTGALLLGVLALLTGVAALLGEVWR